MWLSALPHCTHSPTGVGSVDLTAVLSGVAGFFLILVLCIVGIIIGLVLLRRAKMKRNSLRNGTSSIETVQSPGHGGDSAAGNDVEHHTDDTVPPHYDSVEQCVEEVHYERPDGLVQTHHGKMTAVKYIGGDYETIDDADIPPNSAARVHLNHTEKKRQPADPPTGTPNAVYAVVDKSKKTKKVKAEDGPSPSTTQGVDTEDQHYECSEVFGQDWFGNEVGERSEAGSHSDVNRKGSPYNNTKGTGPQSETCNPNVVYAEVDKSKKRSRGGKNSAPSPSGPVVAKVHVKEGSSCNDTHTGF